MCKFRRVVGVKPASWLRESIGNHLHNHRINAEPKMRRRHVNIFGELRLGLKAVLPVRDCIKPVEERDDGHLTLRRADRGSLSLNDCRLFSFLDHGHECAYAGRCRGPMNRGAQHDDPADKVRSFHCELA